jgi:hypothetical protein
MRVEWPVKNCPAGYERLERIQVYYSTTSGGPYTLGVSPPVDSTSANVLDLQPYTEYCFIVLFEDEAGNAAPAGFDPSVHSDPPPPGEICIVTPAPCCIIPEVTKKWVDVNSGLLLPGDTVTGTVTVDSYLECSLTGVEILARLYYDRGDIFP